ncbi:MAG: ABC-F family ATP-binding cassette domain-containing protein [Candidatus Izemoplasmatales bacterium]|nr:ABC-F family ATP-binding cassette domain-containing protein [Candidatus Izemoplasmatales bacterium]
MNILRINNLNKTFGGNMLFDNISLEINKDEKVALIGRNGVGKTTLVKMILKEIAPDSGEIFIFNKAKIGYLSQKIIESEENTLIDECLIVFKDVIKIEKELHDLAVKLKEDSSELMLKRYSYKEHEYLVKGGYDYLTKAEMLLTRFGFSREDYDRPVESFSGGEKTRIAFAKLLMIEPDLLILDEPTNHMDIEIIEWLEDYLRSYKGSVLVITHDKYFINKVVRKIYEIDNQTIEVYHGNYDDYEIEKVNRYELLVKKYEKQQKQIAHLQSFVDRFRYKATKAKSAQDRIKKINRIERIEVKNLSSTHLNLDFRTSRPTNVHILEVEDLSIGYEKPIIQNISFKMRGFEKIGIIGNNGTGKTTLIKTLMGELKPLKGEFRFYKKLKFGYFDQNLDFFNSEMNLLEQVHRIYPSKTLFEVRSDLARVGFIKEDVYKKISVLSGGELVKLRILLLMLEAPDILVLDEPTNHLDIDSKNIIEDVFEEYQGPVIFISHDRYFINKVATKIIKLDKEAHVFTGNYEEYLIKNQNVQKEKVKKDKPVKHVNTDKLRIKLESEIETLEQEIIEKKNTLFLEEVYNDHKRYHEVESEIKKKEEDLLEMYNILSDLEISES